MYAGGAFAIKQGVKHHKAVGKAGKALGHTLKTGKAGKALKHTLNTAFTLNSRNSLDDDDADAPGIERDLKSSEGEADHELKVRGAPGGSKIDWKKIAIFGVSRCLRPKHTATPPGCP